MQVDVQKQHHWLQQFVGEWRTEGDFSGCPNSPSIKNVGKATTRSLGGIWVITEGSGEMPEGGEGHYIVTLGFDPVQNAFVGTFVGSMMTHLWPYKGTLNAEETMLTLDSEGPSFSGEGMAKYQDTMEIVSKDHWILRSQVLSDEGQWIQFMTSHHYRVA